LSEAIEIEEVKESPKRALTPKSFAEDHYSIVDSGRMSIRSSQQNLIQLPPARTFTPKIVY
jgi:hypothetical protein